MALADDGLLLLDPSPLFRIQVAQLGEYDSVLLGEQHGLGLNGIDFRRSL
jgi:hypothetical protein